MTTEQHPETEVEALARSMAADLGFKHPTLPEGRPPEPSSQAEGDRGIETSPSSPTPNQPAGDPPSSPPSSPSSDTLDPLQAFTPEQILSHPTLGPLLQSRIDSTIAQQTKLRVDKAKEELLPQLKARAEEESLVEYLESKTPDERAAILAQDNDAAIIWGKHLETSKQNPNADAAIAYGAQVLAYKSIIQMVGAAVEGSTLPTDVKAKLRLPSEEQVAKRSDGLMEWQKEVNETILAHNLQQTLAPELEKRYEAYQNERDAKGGSPRRPSGTAAGTQAPAMVNDPKQNSLPDLWDNAFDRLESSRR